MSAQGNIENHFVRYDCIEIPTKSQTNWEHIFIRDGLSVKYRQSDEDDHALLAFKYMPANRLLENIENNDFAFVSPIKWRDPFESLFFENNIIIDKKYVNVKGLCFALNDFENEEGLWHFSPFSSVSNDNPTIRVAFDMLKFYQRLEDYAIKKENVDFYISLVNYKDTSEILRLQENFKPQSIDDYINKLCLKRQAYKHEIELRIFMVKKSEQESSNDDVEKISIPKIKEIISSVTLPPCDPLEYGIHLCPKCYNNKQQSSNKTTYDKFKKLDIRVKYSELYDIYTIRNRQ